MRVGSGRFYFSFIIHHSSFIIRSGKCPLCKYRIQKRIVNAPQLGLAIPFTIRPVLRQMRFIIAP